PFLLSSVVKAFIAQRLVRTMCPHCVQMHDYPREYLAEIGVPAEMGTQFKRGEGCDLCRQTGYQGRLAIYEICVVTEPLKKLIMQKRDGGGSSKSQAPSTREIPNSEAPKQRPLFDFWCLVLLWSLELGAHSPRKSRIACA